MSNLWLQGDRQVRLHYVPFIEWSSTNGNFSCDVSEFAVRIPGFSDSIPRIHGSSTMTDLAEYCVKITNLKTPKVIKFQQYHERIY